MVQPQQGQPQILHRAVVEVGADAAQDALVEGRGARRRSAHAVVQCRVLSQQVGELNDLSTKRVALLLDGIAGPADETGQQQIDAAHRQPNDQPDAPLGGGDVVLQATDRLIELGHGDDPVAVAQAHRAVGLQQHRVLRPVSYTHLG